MAAHISLHGATGIVLEPQSPLYSGAAQVTVTRVKIMGADGMPLASVDIFGVPGAAAFAPTIVGALDDFPAWAFDEAA